MAPMKRPRESSIKKSDKMKRRRRINADTLYNCIGKLCGEECQQELIPVRGGEPRRSDHHQIIGKHHRRNEPQDVEMDAVTDFSDEEYEDEQQPSQGHGSGSSAVNRSGRVSKPSKPKKASTGSNSEMPFKTGVQKAKRWLCAALDFGVQSEYLRPEDSKGKVLRVSSELFQIANDGANNRPRVLQRIGSDDPRASQRSKLTASGNNRRHEILEERDDEGGKVADRSSRKGRRHRRRSRHSKRRSGRSRSRSRSKRRHGRKRGMRSRSANPDVESRPKQSSGVDGAEQDEMNENGKETRAGSSEGRREDDHDDGKSVKSLKSTQNSDSQNTNEEKKNTEDDGSNYEVSDDEDEAKKK